MTAILILYYSAYGHTERMARAVVEGVGEAGAQVVAACASQRS
jgi:NAD(P)H dehydrogenase (quinone)